MKFTRQIIQKTPPIVILGILRLYVMLLGDCSDVAIPSASEIGKKEHEPLVTLVAIRALGSVSLKLGEWLVPTAGEAHGPKIAVALTAGTMALKSS